MAYGSLMQRRTVSLIDQRILRYKVSVRALIEDLHARERVLLVQSEHQ
jgi:hypothetical protein